jgi:hypothetical protein
MLGSNYEILKNAVKTTNLTHDNNMIIIVRDAYDNLMDDNSSITMTNEEMHSFVLYSWIYSAKHQKIRFCNKDMKCVLEFMFLTNNLSNGIIIDIKREICRSNNIKWYKSYWIENDNKPFNIVNCL